MRTLDFVIAFFGTEEFCAQGLVNHISHSSGTLAIDYNRYKH